MKIKKIKFKDHPILKNLELDFTDENGNVTDTVILAGENGCGKTTLLNILSDTYYIGNYEFFPELEIIVNKNDMKYLEGAPNEYEKTLFIFENTTGSPKVYYADANNPISTKKVLPSFQFLSFNRKFPAIYSISEINYSSSRISSVSALDIDLNKDNLHIPNINFANDIKQMLVDIDSADNNEIADWVKENLDKIPNEYISLSPRMDRFKNAFNVMFSDLKFYKIKNRIIDKNYIKDIVFKKNETEISIDDLSSGEKQIVFRGAFLLQDQKVHQGKTVLIDEPEVSLHPEWQKKIVDFYKKIFTNEDGEQTSQIFIATHSPFIIHNENRYNDKVIVLKREGGEIIVSDKQEYYDCGSCKAIEDAFNITSFKERDNPIVFVEGITDENYYKKAMEIYGISGFDIEWIGTEKNGSHIFTGCSSLNSIKNAFEANPKLIKDKKIVLFYDCDTNKPQSHSKNLIVHCASANNNEGVYTKGTENLLKLPADFDRNLFYTQVEKKDDYGAKSTISTLNKTQLCDYICSLPKEDLLEILSHLKKELDIIKNAITTS